MGYLGNHLATVIVSIFAAALSGFYYLSPPELHFILLLAVVVTWFLAGICWIAQKSADYAHKHSHTEKKSSIDVDHKPRTVQVKAVTDNELNTAKAAFTAQLSELHDTVKLKDGEIDRLKQQIASLETLVQIEALKAELANLKVLASKEKAEKKK
jgi:hypothetical protein